MQERILGGNLKVSAVGLGCMGFSHAYGAPTEQKEAIYRLQQAVEMGGRGIIGTNQRKPSKIKGLQMI